jgi:hypothetical protein
MKNHHEEIAAAISSIRGCLPCEIPQFCRNNYFTGKLLTERDFTAEQRYMVDKLRLHHVVLHGWGIVCGLKVKPHPVCPKLRIVVESGLAIDSCGREVRVPQEVELELPKPVPAPVTIEDPCPPEPTPAKSAAKADYLEEEAPPESEPCEPTVTLYVCLRYTECQTELMPAVFDECACGPNGKKPNRICESYDLEILTTTEEPESFQQVREEKEKCEPDDCQWIYKTLLDGCPEPTCIDCIPIAVIRDYTPGQELTTEMIDNRTYRRLLPSTTTLDLIIRCMLEKLPTKNLTKIVDIGWTDRGDYHCHDFMRQFIGEPESPKGFEVTFSAAVNTSGVTRRTFQAIAVRYVEKAEGGGFPEVVPATVRWNPERTKIYLDISPHYARARLDRTQFDLYLLVRCDRIVDERGYAVDGDLLARLDSDGSYLAAPPTGNGIPGGLFESWIRVHHGETHEGGSYAAR